MKETKLMKLYFGNPATVTATLSIVALILYIVLTVLNRGRISFWGRRSLILAAFGLFVCCYAAARDGLDKTIQHAIDGSCAPGVFPLISIPTAVGCIGALIILVAAVATPIAKSQRARELWFYVMSGGVLLKILTVEAARLFL